MPDILWRVAAPFESANRHFTGTEELVDADGAVLVDADGTTLLAFAGDEVQPEDIEGAKSFDTLVLGGQIDLNYTDLTALIASGSSLSAAIPLDRRPVLRLLIPSGWTTASVTLQGSLDGTNYYDLLAEDGNAITLSASAGKFIQISNPDDWAGYKYLKVRSGTSGSPVTQAADRTITLTVRDA